MARKARHEVQRQWHRRLGRFSRSTLSVAEFCRLEKVSVASFYQWRKKLAVTARDGQDTTATAKPTFLPVQVAASPGLQIAFPNGATLTLPVDDHELIKLSIEAIAQAPTTTRRTISGEA